jgi:hypothetical protein
MFSPWIAIDFAFIYLIQNWIAVGRVQFVRCGLVLDKVAQNVPTRLLGTRFTNATPCFEPSPQKPNWDIFIESPCSIDCEMCPFVLTVSWVIVL